MDLEEITLRLSNEVSRFSGKVEVFEGQISELQKTIKEVDDRLNKLRIREAEREGETRGIKKFAIIISTIISLLIGCVSVGIAINL